MATKQKKPMAKTIIKAAVIIGVLIIPLMYSYFYLSAFWDPYSRLQDVSVAVVNLDQGAKINGKDRNVGKEICDNLEEDGSLDFHFVSEADAKDGLMNDKYYAEVLIPADLTDSISTASKNTKKQHAQIQYVANQKRNYLASQILESGMMPTIKETVNGAVNKEITATLTDKLYSVPDALEILKDGLQQLSDGAGSVKGGTQQLSTATISLNVGTEKLAKGSKDLVSGLSVFKAGTAKLADGATQVDTGAAKLQKGAASLKAGTQQLNNNVPALKSGVKKLNDGATALAGGSAALSTNLKAYTDGVANASAGSDDVMDGIAKLQSGITGLESGLVDLKTQSADGATDLAAAEKKLETGVDQMTTQLSTYTTGVDSLITNFETSVKLLTGAYPYISNAAVQQQVGQYLQQCNTAENREKLAKLKQGKSQINTGLASMKQGVQLLETDSAKSMAKLQAGLGQVQAGVKMLDDGAVALNTGTAKLQKGLQTLEKNNDALNAGAAAVATGASQLADGTDTLLSSSGTLAKGVTALDSGAGDLLAGVKALKIATAQLADGSDQINTKTTTIQNGASQLQSGINQLNGGASQLENGAAKLNTGAAALKAGTDTAKDGVEENLTTTNDQLKALDGLADYSEEPVSTDTQHVQPVDNYGSAFAPYFMSLSMWVGGLMIFFGIYLDYQKKIRILSKDSDHVVLRAFVFMLLGLLQAVLLAFVIHHALGIKVANLGMLYLSCCLVSLTFISIIQFCLVHLGDAGKFVALLLLILQLTSCAGTFPIETCPTFFQKLYPFMPMTYSVRLFKEALAGTWNGSVTKDVLILVAIMVVFTLATTLLSAYRDRHKIKEMITNGSEAVRNK